MARYFRAANEEVALGLTQPHLSFQTAVIFNPLYMPLAIVGQKLVGSWIDPRAKVRTIPSTAVSH